MRFCRSDFTYKMNALSLQHSAENCIWRIEISKQNFFESHIDDDRIKCGRWHYIYLYEILQECYLVFILHVYCVFQPQSNFVAVSDCRL